MKGSVSTLMNRLLKEKENRPLIANLTEAELEDYIKKHLFDRSYYYLQSKEVISIDAKNVEAIIKELQERLT